MTNQDFFLSFFCRYWTTYSQAAALFFSTKDGSARIFIPSYAAAWFKPMSVELHQTGTFEGLSTDWAPEPQHQPRIVAPAVW